MSNLMPTYEKIDTRGWLPPRQGGSLTESCAQKKFWSVASVKDLFQQMLIENYDFYIEDDNKYKIIFTNGLILSSTNLQNFSEANL
jgi:hypothetical protein